MNYSVYLFTKHVTSTNCSKYIILKHFNVKNYSVLSSSFYLRSPQRKIKPFSVSYVKEFKRNESTSIDHPVLESTNISSNFFLKLSDSQAVACIQKCLITIHDSTGLPWWGTIVLSTFLLRIMISFPLAVYQNYINAKVENITLIDMPEIARHVKYRVTQKARESRWTSSEAALYYKTEMKDEWNKLIVAQNCHPVKATLPIWFQIPTWVCLSAAIRNLAYMLPHNDPGSQLRFMEMSVGGFLWVPNLAIPDTTLILPIIFGLSNLIIIEVHSMMRVREPTKFQRYATNFFRGFTIILVPVSSLVPAGLCVYWTVSSVFGLCQNLLLISNRVRFGFGIPDTPSTLDRPYAHLAREIAVKLKLVSR